MQIAAVPCADLRIAFVSANLNNFDSAQPLLEQDFSDWPEVGSLYHHVFTDEDFPPRKNALHPRLQQQICKMFSWQLLPGYDYYMWMDSSCAVATPKTVGYFYDLCTSTQSDFVFFHHPQRRSIKEEANYLRVKLAEGNKYLTPRYAGEFLDGLEQEVFSDPTFKDTRLYASTTFMYKNTKKTQKALKEWWYFSSRYHALDQLALPFVLWKMACRVAPIRENYLKSSLLTYTRNKKR